MIADFEATTYGDWKATGEAFGQGPSQGSLPGQQKINGFFGHGLANSFHGGDTATGKLTSPPFKIERNFISFLIGGGDRSGELYLALLIDGKMVRRATGVDSERLELKYWDV